MARAGDAESNAAESNGPVSARRPYDSPVRRRQVAETRMRILDAGCELVHELRTWDWRALTFRAIAERAGVGERTVYRHFETEQALHDAVMHRLGERAGISYEGMALADVAAIGAKVFASMMSTFEAPTWEEPADPAFVAEDERRRSALIAAVGASTVGWSRAENERVAAAVDAIWSAYSYRRLATAWGLDADEAADVIEWLISLVLAAIETGNRPGRSRPNRGTPCT